MKYNFVLAFLSIVILLGCGDKAELIEIAYDKELIPEGIAISPETGKIYLSSIYKDKIVVHDRTVGSTNDLITSGQYGYKHGLGIEIKDGLLFALSSATINGKSSSLLLVYDLEKDIFLDSFQLSDTTSHFMNDLAVSDSFEIYMTDTERNLVYFLQYPGGEIEPYLRDDSLKYPNGIAISEDNTLLFVDSFSEGIRIVDISSGKIVNPSYRDNPKKLAVDGLKYYKGDLYGIRNGDRQKNKHGFVKIKLNESRNDIDTILPVLMNHPQMDIPTTFCIDEGYAYILANSQLERLDQENHSIANKDSLTNTIIIKLML